MMFLEHRKGSLEVKKLNKPELLMKMSIENDGILYSRTRILDAMRFEIAGGLDENLVSLE